MNGFIRSASYLRVSSQRQADENTIDSQREDVRRRALRDDLAIDESFEYIDDGYSGSQLLRPALEQLRDHVAASMIDRLYIHSPDRLARKYAHQAILLEEMNRHGCEVVFLNQEGLPESPETNMLLQMQGMFAEYEREKILERTRRGRRHAATQGSVSVFGRAPFGYRYLKQSTKTGDARWEIDPVESEVVKKLFEMVAHQGSSLAVVCRELQRQGIPTKTGNATWCTATVRGMLRNPAYCGEAKYGKKRLSQRKAGKRAKRGDPVVPRQAKVAVATSSAQQIMIPVPALVSKSLFEEVGKRMDENRKRQRAHQAGTKYLLSGLLICGKCGSAYCQNGGTRYHSYRCIGADKYRLGDKTICDNTSIKGTELDDRVWSDVCELLRDPERLRVEAQRNQSSAPEVSRSISQQELEVNGLRLRVDRMVDAFAAGLISPDEFESRIGNLRSHHDREAAVLASLRGEQGKASDRSAAIDVLATLSRQVEQNLAAATFDLKRTLLMLLVKRIEICESEIRIVYKVPPNPFVPRPDKSGILQHWMSRRLTPLAY